MSNMFDAKLADAGQVIEQEEVVAREQALAALADGLHLVPDMVARIYADTPQHLHGAAAQSLFFSPWATLSQRAGS